MEKFRKLLSWRLFLSKPLDSGLELMEYVLAHRDQRRALKAVPPWRKVSRPLGHSSLAMGFPDKSRTSMQRPWWTLGELQLEGSINHPPHAGLRLLSCREIWVVHSYVCHIWNSSFKQVTNDHPRYFEK